ncbi:MAG: NADH-quinone oxidoreductase subunit NuoK [Candidatus Omnitrophica bacterium]|nr:NADH-quinone oxidoreductase subunit NuoK [Candidatus Omnitrophota bacterium]
MTPPLQQLLALSAVLFAIGLIGVVTRRNIIMILLSLEILLNAANLAFVIFSRSTGNLTGQLMVFFVMIVAAAEVTVGLAIAVVLVRTTGKVNADELRGLKG